MNQLKAPKIVPTTNHETPPLRIHRLQFGRVERVAITQGAASLSFPTADTERLIAALTEIVEEGAH